MAGLRPPEVYDLVGTGTWTATGSLLARRDAPHRHAASEWHRFGRRRGMATAAILPAREVYDPATGTWTATGSLIDGRAPTTPPRCFRMARC